MVERNDSWIFSQHTPWHLPNMECMSMEIEQRSSECSPTGYFPCAISENAALQGSTVPGIPGLNQAFAVPGISSLKVEETYEATQLLQHLHPQFYPLYASTNLYPVEKQHIFTNGITGKSTPCAISGSPQRKLIVFDRSGNQTRLIYNSVCPAQHQTTTAKTLLYPGLHEGNKAQNIDQFTTTKGNMQVFNEQDLNGEESETHEDTEEINALLYSDETSDYSESDDEVTSTGHSPLAIKRIYHKQEQPKDILAEEVASCDGPHKRQKLFDARCNQISLMDTASSVQLKRSNENNIGSSYAIGQTQEKKPGSTPDCDWLRKDKIRNTLKILGNIIPNAKEKDPLLVIDEAINYLTFLKRKAEALGMKFY